MKRRDYWQVAWLLMFSIQGLSCADEGTYQLHLLLPDDLARQSISEVALGAFNPQGHTCNELIQGQVTASQLTAYTNQTFAYPPEQPFKLPMVPSGTLLFFAEGRKGQSVLLRGCSPVEVKAGAKVEVTLSLVWVCHPNPEGEMPGNGIDDDCDGQTDETQICDPGDSKACTCTSGKSGAQICSQDGTRWEECKCLEEEVDGGGSGEDGGAEAQADAGGDELPDGGEAEPDEGLVIDFFTANPQEFIVGQSVALSWSTRNATACTLNGSEVPVSSQGDFVLEQPCPWTYRLDCQGPGQTANKAVTLGYVCPNEPQTINGIVDIKSLDDLTAFVPTSPCYIIQGSLWVRFNNNVADLTPLYGLVEIKGDIQIYGNEILTQLDGLCLIKNNVNGLFLGKWYDPSGDPTPPIPAKPADHYGNTSLLSLAGLSGISRTQGMLEIEENDALMDLHGLEGVTQVDGEVLIQYNPNLASLAALANLTSVGTDYSDYLWLEALPNLNSLTGLEGLQNLVGFLGIVDTNIDTLVPLSNVNTQVTSIKLSYNPRLTGLAGLEWVTSMTRDAEVTCSGGGTIACGGMLSISSNEGLAEINALSNLYRLDESLVITDNNSLQNISGLAHLLWLGSDLVIKGNGQLNSLEPFGSLEQLGMVGTQQTRGISIADNNLLGSLWNYAPISGSNFTCAEIFNNPSLPTEQIDSFGTSFSFYNSGLQVSTSDLAGCP